MVKPPPSGTLARPENPKDIMREETRDDCLACRIIGGGAFLGLGAYSFWSGRKQIEANRAAIMRSKSMYGVKTRQTMIMAISGGLMWMGLYRLMS